MNRLLLLCVALVVFASCQKTPAELNITAYSMTFNQTGAPITGDGVIEISSNTAWTITAADSWVHVDKESGTGNQAVTITLDRGTTDPRGSYITIQAGGVVQTIYVSQIFDVLAEMDDEVFREYCKTAKYALGVLPIDKNNDGIISIEEALLLTYIDYSGEIQGRKLTSLKGIEYFTELEILYCENNAITSLDLSRNTKLTSLHCHYNQLSALNITGCTLLDDVSCGNNRLTALDVSTNTALRHLLCNENEITMLDASKCTLLELLNFGERWFSDNTRTSLDISACKNLATLYLGARDTDVYVWTDFDTTTPTNSIPQIDYIHDGRVSWIKR